MKKSLRVSYGETLAKLGDNNDKIVVLDADLANATQTCIFRDKFPDRFFDMGIAEQNLIGVAAGFAREGFIPFVSTFALFGAGRGYEILRNSVAYGGLNVKFAFSHSGISVGEDGGSHQSIEDIALMRTIPSMTIFAPCDDNEMQKAVKKAIEINGPVYIRVSRPVVDDVTNEETPFEIGKANVLKDGEDACIITCGLMVKHSLEAAEELEKEGISCAVINMHTIKPIDKEIILKYHSKCKVLVSVEEHSIIGGLGSAVCEVIAGVNGAKFSMVGIEDKYGKSGDPASLFIEYGLTKENIIKKIKNNI